MSTAAVAFFRCTSCRVPLAVRLAPWKEPAATLIPCACGGHGQRWEVLDPAAAPVECAFAEDLLERFEATFPSKVPAPGDRSASPRHVSEIIDRTVRKYESAGLLRRRS